MEGDPQAGGLGGTDPAVASMQSYATGLNMADNVVVREQATALIHTSTFQSGIFGHLRRIKENPATATNPMLMDNEGVRRRVGIQTYCSRALTNGSSTRPGRPCNPAPLRRARPSGALHEGMALSALSSACQHVSIGKF
jgi:hypothetical protein